MSFTALALLGLAASGAAVATPGMTNGGAQGLFDRGRNLLTLPARSKDRPVDYRTVESAHDTTLKKRENLTGIDNFFSKIKIGHVLGTLILPALGLPKILEYFNVDSDSIWMKLSRIAIPLEIVGSVVCHAVATLAQNDYVESMKNLVDNFCQRVEVTKDKKITDVLTRADLSDKYMTFDELIMDPGNRNELENLCAIIADKGVGRNLMGSTGIGKTSAVYALAAGILEKNIFESASAVQIWKANKNIMEGTLSDVEGLGFLTKTVDKITGLIGLGKLTGETIAERLERLIANAEKHFLETGQPVLILLDEAHDLLGKSKPSGPSAFSPNDIGSLTGGISFGRNPSSDQLNRSKTAEELGPLFENKLKTYLCKGVMVIATSNGSREDVAYQLLRRIKSVLMKKPGSDQRKEMITKTLQRLYAGTSQQINNVRNDIPNIDDIITLAFNNKNNVQGIGTFDLVDFYFSANEERVKDEGYGSYIEALRKRNILHYEAIKDAVEATINLYKGGGTNQFVASLKENLEIAAKNELNDRAGCLSDVKKYPEVDIERVQKATAVSKPEQVITTPEDQLVSKVVEALIDRLKDFLIPKTAA